MDQSNNVGLAFLTRAQEQPNAPAIGRGIRGSELTFGQLGTIVINMAHHFARHGVAPRKTISIRSDDVVILVSSLYATSLLGARWIFGHPLPTLMEHAQVDFTFDSTIDPDQRQDGAILIDGTWAYPPTGQTQPPSFPGYRSDKDIWIMMKTSGTTGTPKLVGLSHKTYKKRVDIYKKVFPRPGMKLTGIFPAFAPALLGRYAMGLVHGCQIVDSFDPDVWLDHSVDHVFGSTMQVRTAMKDRVFPRKLPEIHLSGATGEPSLIAHLLKSFDCVVNGYGSTEASNTLRIIHTLDGDGNVVKRTTKTDSEVEVLREDGQVAPVGETGEVRVKNDCIADCYINAPAATADAFRDGWFHPGDLARWTEDGNFEVVGRVNEQFNFSGLKVNAALMDFALLEIPGIKDAICFMMPSADGPDKLRCFLSLENGVHQDEVLPQARVALMRIGGHYAVPDRFLFADKLPRNATGKADRLACVAQVEARRQSRKNDT